MILQASRRNTSQEKVNSREALAKSTSKAANFWTQQLSEPAAAQIDYLMLRKLIGEYPWPSAKHRNNLMIVLRGILNIAVEKGMLSENPAARIDNARVQHPQPNLLTPDEVKRVLNWMREHHPPGIASYFQAAMFSGMRPEELIALEWRDVDFEMNVISVVRSFSAGELKATKTYRARLVAIDTHLKDALTLQLSVTGKAGSHVFINPVTGRPWVSEKSQREHYWKPALEACGILKRPAYQTRHTFASLSLTGGANPMWLAAQMGHTSTKMLLERYGKWIDVPGRTTEHSKIESMFRDESQDADGNVVPKVSQPRRDETPRGRLCWEIWSG